MNKTLEKLAENRLESIHEEINALEMEAESLMNILGEECSCEEDGIISNEELIPAVEELLNNLKSN